MKFSASQASAKRLAASFSGEPGAPAATPTTKATRATSASGRRAGEEAAAALRLGRGSSSPAKGKGGACPACFYSRVTVLDWAILAFTFALALWGYRQGLIVGALTLVGFGVGRLRSAAGSAPLLLTKGSHSPYAPLCAALGALLVGALMAVTVESFALGLREKLVRRPVLQRADGAGGAALIASVALGLAWVFGAVAPARARRPRSCAPTSSSR